MTTKKLLLLAAMLALPFGARGDWTYNGRTYHPVDTPAQIGYNGTVTIANNGPYQTITPGADDDKHIASTSYVIGAYNDVIAGINSVKNHVELNKQDRFELDDDIDGYVGDFGTTVVGSGRILEALEDRDVNDDFVGNLVSAKGVLAGILSQRVEVYTNWDDDTDKTEVAFVTASAQE